MSSTLEGRITALEEAVKKLQQNEKASSDANWLLGMIGAFKDTPAFDEVIAHGRAFRESDRPTQTDGDSE